MRIVNVLRSLDDRVGSMIAKPVERELSVVIPTLGRDILRRSLEALEGGTVWPARVIVVDHGRRREIAAFLDEVKSRSFETLWVPSSQWGRAVAVNRGVRCAETRFIAVTDDDCLAGQEWVERMVARLQQHPEAIVTGRVDADDSGVVLAVVADRTLRIQRRPALRFDRLSGGNMAVAKAVMMALGGLDEDRCVCTAEDGEFAYRALRAGVPIVYAPEVAVTHLAWRDEHQRSNQYESYALSQGGFYGKYLRRGDPFIALRAGVHLVRALRRWAYGTARGNRELALNGRAYALGLLPGIRAGWRSGAVDRRGHSQGGGPRDHAGVHDER
jgi:GT2 family glycosyltransferase